MCFSHSAAWKPVQDEISESEQYTSLTLRTSKTLSVERQVYCSPVAPPTGIVDRSPTISIVPPPPQLR